MSLSASSPTFRFSWQPSKQVLIFICTVLCIALACISATAMHWPIKCLAAIAAIAYALISLRNYMHRPAVQFFSGDTTCIRQFNAAKVVEIQHLQWQDWGFVIVLNAQLNGKNSHWFWLLHQLSELEKRNLRLMIRSQPKKECHSMPSITINPVL